MWAVFSIAFYLFIHLDLKSDINSICHRERFFSALYELSLWIKHNTPYLYHWLKNMLSHSQPFLFSVYLFSVFHSFPIFLSFTMYISQLFFMSSNLFLIWSFYFIILSLFVSLVFLFLQWAISCSSQCSMTGVTKAIVCAILSVEWCI